MEGIIFLIIILAIFAYVSDSGSSSSSGGPTVSTNEITYPADIKCPDCNKIVKVEPRNIDSSTWDLRCPNCKGVAYMHPKREERKEQLDNLLNW